MTNEVPIEIREEPVSRFDEHALISIAFEVDRIYNVVVCDFSASGFELTERRLATPYRKEYDLSGNCPADWVRQFDLTNWGLISAWVDDCRVGGAVVAFNTAGVDMLEGRNDLAVLWDLRVLPGMRRRGIASALFAAVEHWAIARGCRELKVETQNINVPACRFYAGGDCELRAVRRGAYPALPDEIMLLWYKSLAFSD